jgi:hypothetical protein
VLRTYTLVILRLSTMHCIVTRNRLDAGLAPLDCCLMKLVALTGCCGLAAVFMR